MKHDFLSGRALLVAIGALLIASAAVAADPAASPQGATPTCDGVNQDRAACEREKGAAKQEARRDGLTSPGPNQEQQNSVARCDTQPAAARAECEARVRGGSAKTTVEGSVKEGGVLRETVTPVPAGR